jgi:hypothetical protein
MEELCKDLPISFLEYMKYVKKLSYFDKPDYEFLIGLFKENLKKINTEKDNLFDWKLKKLRKDKNKDVNFIYIN